MTHRRARAPKVFDSRSRSGSVLAAALLGFATWTSCSGPLPSETPLGMGPLAHAEASARAKAFAERDTDGGADAATPSTPTAPPAPTEPTIASGSGGASAFDAGTSEPAADAGPASAKGKTVVPYAGTYVGKDSSIYKLSGQPDASENDPNAKTKVEDRSDGGVTIIPIDSSNGKEICRLEATTKDPARKLFEVKRGQRCFEPEQGSVSGTISSGRARFDGAKLVLDLDLGLEINSPDGRVTGNLIYHFEGTRQ